MAVTAEMRAEWVRILENVGIPPEWDGITSGPWQPEAARKCNALSPGDFITSCLKLNARYPLTGKPAPVELFVASHKTRAKTGANVSKALSNIRAELRDLQLPVPNALQDVNENSYATHIPATAETDGGAKLTALTLVMYAVPTSTQVALNEQPEFPDPQVVRAAIDKRRKERMSHHSSAAHGLISQAVHQPALAPQPVAAADGGSKGLSAATAPGHAQVGMQSEPIMIDDDPTPPAAE